MAKHHRIAAATTALTFGLTACGSDGGVTANPHPTSVDVSAGTTALAESATTAPPTTAEPTTSSAATTVIGASTALLGPLPTAQLNTALSARLLAVLDTNSALQPGSAAIAAVLTDDGLWTGAA